MIKKRFTVSVVVPVLNEEENIRPFLERLLPQLEKLNSYEIIFIDDGSTDNTAELIKNYAQTNKDIKLISFTRNFGHQMALTAGYQLAKGDCVISLDVDLQDPPEIIPQMIEKWKKGALIVYAKRKRREKDSFFKKITAYFFYYLINFLSDTPIPENVGDFRLIDRKVVDFLNNLKEKSRFLRGLVAWPGFKTDFVYFNREKRHAGETHYPLRKMVNFALEGIISFSIKPLRLASFFGFIIAGFGFFGILYAILGKLLLPEYWVTGWTGLFVAIMFLGGVQLITIGIIGEYIGKIYQEIQDRPFFVIKEKVNL